MSDGKACLPFWEGFHVVDLQVGADMVHISLEPDPASSLNCSGCDRGDLPVHEYCRRRIRDLPMLGKTVLLQVRLRRVACPDCGARMEAVPWLERHARLTRRLADAASTLRARMATAHMAELFGLHWSTVRALDERRLTRTVEALPEAMPRRLAMDEFALYKGHRYASVVLDADTRRCTAMAASTGLLAPSTTLWPRPVYHGNQFTLGRILPELLQLISSRFTSFRSLW